MMLASSLNAAKIFFYFLGFTHTSMGNAIIIFYTWPVFAAILSMMFLKERLTKKNLSMILIAFIGIILIYLNKEITFANNDFFGMTSMMIAAVFSALTIIIFKHESQRYTKLETIFYQNIVGAAMFIPFFLIGIPTLTVAKTMIATSYALLIGIVGFALFFMALKKIDASKASFLCYFEVLGAIIFSIIFFNEILTWHMVTGAILIIYSAINLER